MGSCIIIMKFLVVASALVAGICAEADPALLYAGYAGYPYALGYGVGLKSAPCVNAANVPVPCAAGYGLVHHYGKREAEAEADPALLYGAYAAAVPFGSSTGLDPITQGLDLSTQGYAPYAYAGYPYAAYGHYYGKREGDQLLWVSGEEGKEESGGRHEEGAACEDPSCGGETEQETKNKDRRTCPCFLSPWSLILSDEF